jgi:hypothetical protein
MSQTIFHTTGPEAERLLAIHRTRPDQFSSFAIAKLGMPEGWKWCEVSSSAEDAPPGFIRIKGRVKRSHKKDIVFAKRDELLAYALSLADAAGKCWRCWGTGKQLAGTSVKDGPRFRECADCAGTGKPGEVTP